MAKFKYPQNSFFKGEVSPRLYSRTDLKDYPQSCEELLNAIPTIQGGAGRRPGSQFLANKLYGVLGPAVDYKTMTSGGVETTTTTNPKRIFPFITPDETYVIVFSVVDPANLGGSYNPMYWIKTSDINNFVNGVDSVLTNSSIDLTNVASGLTLPFGGYTLKQLPEIQYAQSGDVLILTHPDVQPMHLWRQVTPSTTIFGFLAHHQTLLATGGVATNIIRYTLDGTPVPFTLTPFLDRNTNTSHTMTINNAAVGTGRTLTSSLSFFSSSHVGAYFKSTNGGTTGLCQVTAYTNDTTVTVTVIKAFAGVGAYADWEESAWSNYRGWPRSVCFYQQRAIYGGNKHFPNTIWASRVGNFQWLDAKGYADGGSRTELILSANDLGTATPVAYGNSVNIDPFSVKIAANEAAIIQWMSPDKNLLIGTKDREWIGKGPDPSQVIGPFNIDFSPETKNGATYIQPARFGNGLMFVQQDGQVVREFVFNFQEDAYRAENLSRDAEHMVRKSLAYYASTRNPAIQRFAYQQLDTGILWCLDTNGGLFACSRDRETGQIAWHAHKLGGLISGETAKVIDICVIPRTEIDSTNYSQGEPRHLSDLYLLVLRTVNSSTVVYLERIAPEFQSDDIDNTSANLNNKPIYMDSAKVKTLGVAGTSFSGFDHLTGQTVKCILDGSYIGEHTVTAGVITTTQSGLQLIAGLHYRAIIKPLPIEAGSIIGSAVGTLKTVNKIFFNFVRTIGAKFGKSTDDIDLETIEMRAQGLATGTATPLFTGQIEKNYRAGYDGQISVAIVQDDPMPLHVSGFFCEGQTND